MDTRLTMPTPTTAAPSRISRLRRYLDVGFLKSFLGKVNANRGMERYRKAGITASTSLLSKALTLVISFVSVPLTIRYLGDERYGVWLTISSLLTWMALTDFGIAGNALVNVIAEADGNDSRQTAREYAASAFWSLASVSVTLGAFFALIFQSIPWRSVFRVSAAVSTAELHLSCALTLLIFVMNLPLNMINSIYSAYQDGFVANLWGIGANVIALVGLVVVSQFHGGLPALIIATSLVRVGIGIANGIYLFTIRYRWLSPAPTAVRWIRVKRLFQLGSKYMFSQLASLGLYQSQPLIITQMLGPSKVPIFVIAYKIVSAPVDLAYIATAPFVSAFSEAKARQDWSWIRSAFKNSTLAVLAVGVPATVVIGLAAKILVRLLGGPDVVPDWSVIAWIGLYTLIGMALMTTGQLLAGMEQVEILAISLTICALGTIGLGVLFAHPWGLTGVAAGMAIAKVVSFLPLQGYHARRLLRELRVKSSQQEAEKLVA